MTDIIIVPDEPGGCAGCVVLIVAIAGFWWLIDYLIATPEGEVLAMVIFVIVAIAIWASISAFTGD